MELAVGRIYELALHDKTPYDRLAEMTDLYGPRPSGSSAMNSSVNWMLNTIRSDNLTVSTESVVVDEWRRNNESLVLHIPTRAPVKLNLLGLGKSIGTPSAGITGKIIVVREFDELHALGHKVKGHVVVYNYAWQGYGKATAFRGRGAVEAAKYGAVAVLVRSATPFSLNTPHTGGMEPARIPAAAITVEDADYLDRMYHRYLTAHNSTSHYKDLFVQPTVTLTMNAQTIHNQLSQNIILELKGRELTDEIVLAGGHIDSWDVGMGVLDNGAGFFTAWHALRVIAQLTTPPRRTIRIVGWTDEEKGGAGARAYFANHQHELPQHVLAIESDAGIFQPWGLEFSGEPAAATRLMEIGRKYLGEHGAGNVTTVNGPVGADTALLCREHVPCAGFLSLDPLTHEPPTKSNNYFYYHHTMADTLNAIHSKDVSASVASMASWLYLVAEQDDNLRQM